MSDADPEQRVTIEVTRTVTIKSPDGRPSLELKYEAGKVHMTPLPRNSGRRDPVLYDDLRRALDALGHQAA